MLSACVITKNEEPYIGRLLSSLTACPEVVVLDTGSTDRTREIAAAFPSVVLRQATWTNDFSAARNTAASYAKHGWLLWLDADMYFPPGELEKILALLPRVPPDVDGICLKVVDPAGTLSSPRIYRRGLQFTGAVHEDPGCTFTMQTPFVLLHQRTETEPDRRAKDQRYEQLLQAERAANPQSAHARLYLRDLAMSRKDYLAAQTYIAELSALKDDYLNPYSLARIAYEKGQFEPAIDQAFRALRLNPMDPRVYVLIADAYDELGKKVEALVFYEHALRLPEEARLVGTPYAIAEDDYHVLPLVNQAKVFVDMGLKDKALACYEEALRRNPQTPHRAAIERNRAVLRSPQGPAAR